MRWVPHEALARASHADQAASSGARAQHVQCCLGAVPAQHSDASANTSDLRCFDIELPQRSDSHPRWSTAGCDEYCGLWRSYLLLLSESAAMEDQEILFPNKIVHAGRTLFNATPSHTLGFLADPCVSEVRLGLRCGGHCVRV
jgi:hypothetical protein